MELSPKPLLAPRPGINLRSPQVQRDPYPTYQLLRESYPVCQLEPYGHFALSRYDDVVFALSRSDLFKEGCSAIMQPDWLPDECKRDFFMLSKDPPEHDKYASLVNKAFVGRVINGLIPLMQQTARGLIDGMRGRAGIDFFDAFAYPYVGAVIGQIIGTGQSQKLDDIRRWIELMELSQPDRPCEEDAVALEVSIREQNAYYDDIIRDRSQNPREDLVTGLINARIDGAPLSHAALRSALDLFISAGFQTTAQMLANAMVYLSQNPSVKTLLKNSPDMLPLFVEEILRFFAPTHCLLRTAAQPVVMHGITIPTGSLIYVIVASANRDPRQFARPEQFEWSRSNSKKHVSFGYGVHMCIGAALARLEVKVGLETLLAAFTEIECPSNDELEWLSTMTTRGLRTLPIRLS